MEQLAAQFMEPPEALTLHVGFLGEFNAGKSTLLNALIGRKILPAMAAPTTGSLIEVVPKQAATELSYYRRSGEFLSPISALEFSEIATGQTEGIAVVEVPETGALREGYVLVDTPGLSSIRRMHRDLTLGCLPLLDGAVVCVDVNQGGVSAALEELLKRPELVAIAPRIVYAVCRADQKEGGVEKVREAVIEAVQSLASSTEPPGAVLAHVVAVAAKPAIEGDAKRISAFLEIFGRIIIEPKQALLVRRNEIRRYGLGVRLRESLIDRRENLRLDDAELAAKEKRIDEAIRVIEVARAEEERRLHGFLVELRDALSRVAARHRPALSGASEDELPMRAKELAQDMERLLHERFARFERDIEVTHLRVLPAGVTEKLATIHKHVEAGKTVVTAAIAVAITAGSSAAAEAAETAGAAVAREAARRAGKKKLASRLGRLVDGVAAVIKAVNPVEYAGDIFATWLLGRASGPALAELVDSVNDEAAAEARRFFIDRRFRPIEEQLGDARESLRIAWDERRKASAALVEDRAHIDADLATINTLLAKTVA